MIEFGAASLVIVVPQLALALLGGWLNTRLGLTIVIERRSVDAIASANGGDREHAEPEGRLMTG